VRSRTLQFSLVPNGTVGSTHTGFTSFHTPVSSISDGYDPYHSTQSSPLSQELLQNLKEFCYSFKWWRDETQRQLLRLQGLRDGGGLGFMVDLFFLAFEQLIFTSLSTKPHSALYTGTFRAITSDWSKHKHSLGTQKPPFEGQKGPHVDEAAQEFESSQGFSQLRERLLSVIIALPRVQELFGLPTFDVIL